MPPFEDDPTSQAWLKGPRITSSDLKHGTGSVVLLDSLTGDSPSPTPAAASRNTAPNGGAQRRPEQPQGATCWFGKHRGKLLVDLRDEEPGYWKWACSEVGGFENKVRKLGLLDD